MAIAINSVMNREMRIPVAAKGIIEALMSDNHGQSHE